VSGSAQEVEGGGKDEDGGEDDDEGEEPLAPLHVAAGGGSSPQSRYQRSEHLVAFGAVEPDTSGAKEEDEQDTEKEDEHDEEEGEDSEAASESGEDSGSGAANEEASLTRIEKQAPLPLAHRSAAASKAGPPPLEPQTPVRPFPRKVMPRRHCGLSIARARVLSCVQFLWYSFFVCRAAALARLLSRRSHVPRRRRSS
jgi:hypothetical protein